MAESHIEIAVGGDGADTFVGGGRSSVFVRGGAGDDLIIGGAANDALSGEDGSDVIDGGAGNDLIRGHRGRDQLLGGAGDDVLDGGLEDDALGGGSGNDVLTGGRGDDSLNGGDGIDVAQYAGSYADYRISRISDANGSTRYRVVDIRTGADGADTLTDIEKLSFSDISRVDLTLGSPLPVKDVLTVDSTGQALGRSAAHLISKNQLLANDRDWDSATSQLSITAVLEARGGTVSLTQNGDVLFTPDPTYSGVMSFKYRIKDNANHVTEITNGATGQSEVMKGAVYLQTADLKDAQGRVDPLLLEQWYLSDVNVMPVWQDYSGKGVRIGQFEPGGAYSTGPEVFDYRHPDLQPNADKVWLNMLDGTGHSNTPETFSSHATMVAGVMVAARNGEGGVGVAYNARLAGHYIQGEGLEVRQLDSEISSALARFRDYDVVNNSWGPKGSFGLNVVPVGALESNIAAAVSQGRNGLGTAIVMAGGNDRATGANTNYNALTANRAVIVAGSINAPGDLGSLQVGARPFSNPGASILVSAPGSNIESTSRELIASNGSTFGSDYNTSQGTSFAAPIVSGVIALMLEANPGLGYRDIQTILAMSATKVNDPNGTDWATNTARTWNGGGMHVSHDYGFGKVDARAAVRLAEAWTEQNTFGNEYTTSASSGAILAAIPDGSGMLTRTLSMGGGLEVESAQVTLELDHQRWGDLIVKLISPTGTESVLVNRPGKAPGSAASDRGDASSGILSFSFNSTRLLGEQSAGTWTLQVLDAATGQVGTLKNWKLDLYGKAADTNDVYVYTNEFATFAGAARGTLTDSNGGRDTLNASAVTGNSVINLNNGSTSTLAGKSLAVSGDIEIAFGGDGDDTLTGNATSNVLLGGRGADLIHGGDGNDTLDGGKGSDLLTGGAGSDLFVIGKDPGAQDAIVDLWTGTGGAVVETIAFVGFGGLRFDTLSRTQVGADVRLDLGDGQTVLLRNQQANQLAAAQFQFFDSQAALQAWQLAGQGGGIGGPTEGDDVLQGTTGDDVLAGLGGNDTLAGNDGNDKLLGGSGRDALNGGAGNDVLVLDGDQGAVSYATGSAGPGARTGGTGADRFLVAPDGGGATAVGLSGADMTASNLIRDFDLAVDKIDLSQFAWITSFSQLTATKALTINSTFITRVSAQASGQPTVAVGLYGIEPAALTAANFIFAGSADATPMPVSNASASTAAGAAPLAIVGATAAAATQPPAISGTSADDMLVGDAGANTLDGLAGADGMTGRTGDDTYVVDHAGDTISELPGGGYDSVQSTVNYTLSANVEALVLGGSADLGAMGNDQRNRLAGNAGANRLDGAAEADDMVGGAGNDTYVVDNQLDTVFEGDNEGVDSVESAVSWTLGQNVENLVLTGSDHVNATGNALANALTGNTGDNILDGAEGADSMAGGGGNDTYYVDNAGDAVAEALNGGLDTAHSSVNVSLGANVENAVLFGAATSAAGNVLDNTLVGNGLANTLSGDAGNDFLEGQGGDDALYGGSGDDYLDGGRGRNALAGGLGNDTYVVGSTDSTGFQIGRWSTQQGGYSDAQRWFTADVNGDGKADLVNVFNDGGTMSADAHISTGTGYQIQRWATRQGGYWDAQRWSVADVNGDGKADLVNIYGESGAMSADAHISTGSGFQIQRWATRQGGYGDAQRWSVADVNGDGKADLVNIYGDNGAMSADAHISTGSGFQIQRWATQQGGYWDAQRWSIADVNGDGRADLVNIYGESGAMSADAHISTGSDFQIQRWATRQGAYWDAQRWSLADVNGDGKADLVNIYGENGAMSADAHISTGSGFQIQRWATRQGGYWDAQRWSLADVNGDGKADLVNIYGENGAMNADAHVSTGRGFQIQRWATQQGGYSDSSQRWSLADANGDGKSDLVNLMNDGGSMSADVHASGNAVDPRSDAITEQAGEGIDTVHSSSSHTLAPTLENLILRGSEIAQGSGNASGNGLTGNAAMNTLKGYAGDDVLDGGGGDDFLLGGAGNDTYVLGRGHGVDRIGENDGTGGNTDVALFNAGIAADQLWFRQAGNDLEVSVIGTGDKFLIGNWYLGGAYHVEQFKTSDGHVLQDSQVQNLVQAMASFSPPTAGQTTLLPSYQSSLNAVIAANWQ
ncbi:S8 family serine peptidase [Variovorax sp. JS1663]|uniref:S8 family serine peptidase n=1 Tax=Variovorax sp. JS1663 TaxID=1851577 RepID=UPI00235303DE|nr:S8 family serine peptidase [Variovorax sp. JS1663]